MQIKHYNSDGFRQWDKSNALQWVKLQMGMCKHAPDVCASVRKTERERKEMKYIWKCYSGGQQECEHDTNSYKGSICKLEIWPKLTFSGWVLSSWSTRTSSVPDSLSQAATTDPVDVNRPKLHLDNRKGAPMPIRSASTARLSALSPTTLLCLPHPVRMLKEKEQVYRIVPHEVETS